MFPSSIPGNIVILHALSLKHCKLLFLIFYRAAGSLWFLHDLPGLCSLSNTHDFSNYPAFLQEKITLTDSDWRLSPKMEKSCGNLLWDTIKKLLVSIFKCTIVSLRLMSVCTKFFFADCINTTPEHMFVLLVNQYYLNQHPLPFGGEEKEKEKKKKRSALFTTQLFCLLRTPRLDIGMDIYLLYWTGKLPDIYWFAGCLQKFHFPTYLHRLTDCCHWYQ